jgi:hypothetical protein
VELLLTAVGTCKCFVQDSGLQGKEGRKALLYSSISQPPDPGINYTGPQEVLLELVILVI